MKSRLATTALWCALLFCAATADLSAQTPQPAVDGSLTIQGTLIIQEPTPVPNVAEPAQLVVRGLEDFAPTYGPPTVASVPECGGMLPNGQPQAACPPKIATKVGAARRDCPSGSFFDLTTWSCWQCPANFNRSAAPVVSEQACSQPTAAGLTRTSAKLLGGAVPRALSSIPFEAASAGVALPATVVPYSPSKTGAGPARPAPTSSSSRNPRPPSSRRGSASLARFSTRATAASAGPAQRERCGRCSRSTKARHARRRPDCLQAGHENSSLHLQDKRNLRSHWRRQLLDLS